MASGRKQYPFHLIEPKWQAFWDMQQTFRAFNPGEVVPPGHPFGQRHALDGKETDTDTLPQKFYILDMFPYPSGAGLHVGHPEGYTATDILARYKRAQGMHVLHPIGWDAFGLPAEQYAIKTGQHPRKTTETNIATFKRQIKSLGFSYDWSREVDTTDPNYFKWTQWIFLKLYNSYFDTVWNKATPISLLEDVLSDQPLKTSTWESNPTLKELHKRFQNTPVRDRAIEAKKIIDESRLAYVTEAPVWWCPELGTVLANEEVIDGKSEVGGFPVVQKQMRQWMLRITAYSERLLRDLDTIDWTDSLKEMQRNWIGRSEGAFVTFKYEHESHDSSIKGEVKFEVFTTRPDTLYGATYIVLAPENKLVDYIIPASWPAGIHQSWKGTCLVPDGYSSPRDAVSMYRAFASAKKDVQRKIDASKSKTGVFTGAYAINPVNDQPIPIFIADYVLSDYGTGAIMAVPAHDERDWEFAKQYGLPIKAVVMPDEGWLESNKPENANILSITALQGQYHHHPSTFRSPFCGEGYAINSTAIESLPTPEAKKKITAWLESKGLGQKTINYKLRDWLFSRQRYWGEPFPIVWKNGHHEALPESSLPLLPPSLDDYKPTPDGQPPLARAKDWVNLPDGSQRETNSMPQWAGSCWYYLRYLDATNSTTFVDQNAENYWMGSRNTRHATRVTPGVDLYVGGTEHAVLHLLYARFWHKVLFDLGHVSTPEPFFKLVNQGLILGEDGQKMSKSRGNVVNPDDILKEYGADAFRLYEMFMGPLQDTKPWSTKGVEGVYRFLGRAWRLFVDEQSETEFEQAETVATEAQRHGELLKLIKLSQTVKDVPATPAQLKTLHACIKKVTEDLDGMRFNTAISAMMVFINDALSWETKPVSVLKDFLTLLAPFAPHIAEELWDKLHSKFKTQNLKLSLSYAPWPKYDPALLVEDTLEIPVQVNGKLRDVIKVAANADNATIEAAAKSAEKAQQFLAGKTIKKVIIVPRKLVNIVVAG